MALHVFPLLGLSGVRPQGRKLSNKTLQTLAKYFESIFLALISNGSIQRKYDKQLCSPAKHELCHKLKECYREKLKRLSESQESHYSRVWHRKPNSRSTCDGRPTCYGNCCHFKAHCSNYKDPHGDCKAPSEEGRLNKPCNLHGIDSKCIRNPVLFNRNHSIITIFVAELIATV